MKRSCLNLGHVLHKRHIMTGIRISLAFLGLMVAVGAHADNIVVAEFRANSGLAAGGPGADGGADRDRYYPDNLYAEEIGGSEELSWSFGQYTFSGIMNWEQRANYWAGHRFSDEQFFSLGSKFAVGDTSETRLYHGFARDRLAGAGGIYGIGGDSEIIRTGVSQSLYFAGQRARLGLGYEYATGDREAAYQGLEGHEINVSGEVRIGWGINAHLEAGYGLYSYNQFEGIRGDLSSARTNMRAGISRSFTPALSWGLHYSYIDEEFGVSELSESRRSWGLNLEYKY